MIVADFRLKHKSENTKSGKSHLSIYSFQKESRDFTLRNTQSRLLIPIIIQNEYIFINPIYSLINLIAKVHKNYNMTYFYLSYFISYKTLIK